MENKAEAVFPVAEVDKADSQVAANAEGIADNFARVIQLLDGS